MMIKTKATADVVQTVFDKIPSTVCNGFLDVHGVWNNGKNYRKVKSTFYQILFNRFFMSH